LAELAGEVQKHLRAETGRVRKCLILDCDNTLWGGIVGEDGVGKSAVSAAVCTYIADRGMFEDGVVFVRSQRVTTHHDFLNVLQGTISKGPYKVASKLAQLVSR
jgi:ABC-type dipeptide/oligopeptide/nickel transport system ATPase component